MTQLDPNLCQKISSLIIWRILELSILSFYLSDYHIYPNTKAFTTQIKFTLNYYFGLQFRCKHSCVHLSTWHKCNIPFDIELTCGPNQLHYLHIKLSSGPNMQTDSLSIYTCIFMKANIGILGYTWFISSLLLLVQVLTFKLWYIICIILCI